MNGNRKLTRDFAAVIYPVELAAIKNSTLHG